MYLKAIEVQGFKSFANKMRLDFNDGITGIVGPNGSGKSNVADAMRWVLGEQSAKTLRGSNMQDIIFAGTTLRKPQSYAYVAIVLDNKDRKLKIDFDEVIVARKVYRSGESEYLLNNSVCRLKDIQELFYDTGIGKEGYSIIGQGQIDRILSEKPEERRELFDEAAGIVKFKKNKMSAIKKLESERESLARLNDIIFELKSRVPALKSESDRAKEFLNKRDELKKNEIDFFNLTHKKRSIELKEIAEKLELAESSLYDSNNRLNSVKTSYENNEKKIDEAEKDLSELSNFANDKEIEKNQYESQIDLINEQINTLNEKSLDCENRSAELENSIKLKKDEICRLEEKEQNTIKEFSEKTKEVDFLKIEFSDIVEKIAGFVQTNNEQTGEIFSLSGQINVSTANIEKNNEQMAEISDIVSSLETKKIKFSDELNIKKEELIANGNSLKNAKEKLNECSKNIIEFSKKLEELKEAENDTGIKIREFEKKIDSDRSKINIYKNMISNYEGYSNAIKKIMGQKDKEKGIIGVVADIIELDKKYEIAMQVGFGAKLQNVIVEDENVAKRLIKYLKDNKYGRATFLPINNITDNSHKNRKILNEKGVIGYASDIIRVEEAYRNIISYLLGTLILVDDIENAAKISKKYMQSLRIVTLQGELIAPGGSITGGDYKNSYNFLGRKNEIEELQKELENLESNLNEIIIKKDISTKEIKDLNEKLSFYREKESEIKLNINSLLLNENGLKNIVNSGESSIEEINLELKSRNDRLKTLRNENDNETAMINEKTLIIDELKQKRSDMQEESDKLNQERFDKGNILEEKKIEFAKLEQEMNFDKENLLRIRTEVEELQDNINRLNRQAQGAKTEADNKKDEIESLKKIIENTKKEHNEYLRKIDDTSNIKAELINSNKELFRKLDELKNENISLSDEKNRLISMKEKSEIIIEQLLDYMWNEYELSAGAIKEYVLNENISLNLIEKNIKTLKNEIKSYGNVNIGAIEEYKEVSERFEFLTNQKSDIEKSEASLITLIKELDIGMINRFKDRFKEINIKFDTIFKKLFGGGSANLRLIDEENILETGISINVQPPGKKLQNMLVLSGGEKALTAIALLFAIQSLKPSIFCVLDEIEASLDDSNVDRFANYLNKLTEHTQFIVITHRKGTMEVADRLYGITMQEKGVSTLVSVSLVEKELN